MNEATPRRRVLILGAAGMFGHMACRVLAADFQVTAAARRFPPVWKKLLAELGVLKRLEVFEGFDAVRLAEGGAAQLLELLELARPEVLVNGIGIIKQRPEAEDPLQQAFCRFSTGSAETEEGAAAIFTQSRRAGIA